MAAAMLKNKLLVLKGGLALFLLSYLFCAPLSSFAQTSGDINNRALDNLKNSAVTARIIENVNSEGKSAYTIVSQLINTLLAALAVYFFILVVFGGYRWMVAGGNKTKVDAAVKLLYQAAIGFLIIAIAFILSNLIFFGLSNIATQIKPPL